MSVSPDDFVKGKRLRRASQIAVSSDDDDREGEATKGSSPAYKKHCVDVAATNTSVFDLTLNSEENLIELLNLRSNNEAQRRRESVIRELEFGTVGTAEASVGTRYVFCLLYIRLLSAC